MLLGPKIKGCGSDFIHDGVCEAALGQVHSLDVRLAGVTALHTDMGKLVRGIDRQLLVVFFAAVWTHDAAQLPFA
jgi:hypothetical protein